MRKAKSENTDRQNYLSKFGARVRQARKRARLTQEQLAEKCHYEGGRATISQIEVGKSDISMSMVNVIADALNTTPIALMDGDNDPATLTLDEAELLRIFRTLTPADRFDMISVVNSYKARPPHYRRGCVA
jgi:transcriptional regulator with XRE-family HTH domain